MDKATKGYTNIQKYLLNSAPEKQDVKQDVKQDRKQYGKQYGKQEKEYTDNTTKFDTSYIKNKFTSGIGAIGAIGMPTGTFGMGGIGMPNGFSGFSGFGEFSNVSVIARIFAYLFSILIVVFIMLLFIHYFIVPVFSFTPGSSGIIPIPGFDTGKLFWDKTNPGQILNKDLPISFLYFNYTLNLDIFIQNPYQFSKYPRILLSRGIVNAPSVSNSSTLLSIIDNYNLVIALLPDTNDILVSVLNANNGMENAIIRNVPIQESFRIGVVVMEVALEVYLNGRLIKTRQFSAPPKDVKNDIYPASGIEKNIAKLRNLKIWARTLTVSEIRNATPKLSSDKEFNADQMPSSSTCGITTPDTSDIPDTPDIPDIDMSGISSALNSFSNN